MDLRARENFFIFTRSAVAIVCGRLSAVVSFVIGNDGVSVLRNENLPFIRVYDLSPAGIRIGWCESPTLLLAHVAARLNIAGRSGADFWNDLD